MQDATFIDCDNAIEDPMLWIKGSARCDGVAAWPTMRVHSLLAMLSASSISTWNAVWSRTQWIRWRSGPFQALMKPAPVSWMHWLTCFEGRCFLIFAPIQHVNVWWQGCSLGTWHVTEFSPQAQQKGSSKECVHRFIDDDFLVIWNDWPNSSKMVSKRWPPTWTAARWHQIELLKMAPRDGCWGWLLFKGCWGWLLFQGCSSKGSST